MDELLEEDDEVEYDLYQGMEEEKEEEEEYKGNDKSTGGKSTRKSLR